ncbi:hypothetical protein ACFL2X_01345, partial [Candidatus Latescibacterota bacterium]
ACSSGRGTILIEETDSIASCFATPDTSEYFDNKFVEAQLKPFDDPSYHESAKTLHYKGN